jgi:hemerythrin-like domain-containing protein
MSSTARKPAAKASSKSDGGDAVKLLTADHKEVHTLFQKYKKLAQAQAPADERQPLAECICALLTVHATIEEEIFYPAAREAGVESALLDEAEVEHATGKDLIAQLQSMDADDELYDAKVTVLGEYVDHHVKEEQDEMFPACRKAKMDLDAVGTELEVRKLALMQETMDEPA